MMRKNALFSSMFLLAAACGGAKPKPEPKPEPQPANGEIPCTAELALPCDTDSADGCLDDRTLFHVCVPGGQTAGPSCEQEIMKVCPEGQVDACMTTPQFSTSHLCVYPNAVQPVTAACPDGQAFYAPGCGDDTNALTTEGCYASCETAACGDGFTCTSVTYDPCHDQVCDACGGEAKLCMPST